MRFTSTCVPYFQIKDKHGRHPTSKHNLYHRHLLRRTRTESICHLRKSSNNKQVDSFYQPGRGSSGSHIHTATKPRLHQLRTSVFISNLVQHYWEGGCLPRLATISLYAVIQQHYEEEKNTDRPSDRPTISRLQPDLFFKCFSFPRERNRFHRCHHPHRRQRHLWQDPSLGSSRIPSLCFVICECYFPRLCLPSTCLQEKVLQQFEVSNAMAIIMLIRMLVAI